MAYKTKITIERASRTNSEKSAEGHSAEDRQVSIPRNGYKYRRKPKRPYTRDVTKIKIKSNLIRDKCNQRRI